MPTFRHCLRLVMALGLGGWPASAQIVRLPHADTTRGNYFGASVALHGNQAIVGASAEDSCGKNGGAAYVFLRSEITGDWQKEARLMPKSCESGLYFGRRVDIHGDFALVASSREYFAAEKPNVVYAFHRDSSGTWQEIQRLTIAEEADEGAFGFSLTLGEGLAVVTTSGDVSQSRHQGAAYVFELQDSRWEQTFRLAAGRDLRYGVFGGSTALAGSDIAIAATGYFNRRPGSVQIFSADALEQYTAQKLIQDVRDVFISLDGDGRELLVGQARGGHRNSGVATLFAKDSTHTWELSTTLRPPTPYREGGFGTEVALSGDRALVVGYDEQLRLNYNVDRVVYVFRRRHGAWHYQSIIDIGEYAFASSMDLDGPYALIGASSADSPGAAYIIRIP